jgi:peptidoglycan/xylan/chitin deacetylase (PgdA/CDA1 family)
MAWRTLALIFTVLGLMAAVKARAEECPGNPSALGTSRVMTIDAQEFPRIGKVQYSHTLPLADKEVVLSFDDGPLPPYTNRILDVLAEQCVRANYFIIGRMARGYPDLLRKIHAAGHVVGSHSENHPLAFERMPLADVKQEVEQGFASLHAVLGSNAVAPFFRIPGLLRAPQVEAYLASRGLVTWSADLVADDWKHINASEVVRRAISRLDEKGKGILLLHDIQPATALALPELLRELQAKGYRIVQVAPGRGGTPVAANTPSPLATQVVSHAAPEAPAATAVPMAAADRMASGRSYMPSVPHDSVRPYTSTFKPARNMPTPGKMITTEPGGWPRVVSVPMPEAGGIGVSAMPHGSETADGRFLLR